jgi:hypothetical protein
MLYILFLINLGEGNIIVKKLNLKILIRIVVVVIILFNIFKHLSIFMQLNNFTATILFDAGMNGTYLIEVEPYKIHIWRGKTNDFDFADPKFNELVEIYSEKEKRLSKIEMYNIIWKFKNVNLYKYEKSHMETNRQEAIIYINKKAYQVNYDHNKLNSSFQKFIELLSKYSLFTEEFEGKIYEPF